MKYLPILLLAVVGVSVADVDHCSSDVNSQCGPEAKYFELQNCNSVIGNFTQHGLVNKLQDYAELYVARSFEYLQTAAYFHNYQKNRGGFSKLFKKLSDEAWNNGIELIKHITHRGGDVDLGFRNAEQTKKDFKAELYELESLARALHTQKEIATHAFHIHRMALRNNDNLHDAEIAQYIEEEFVENQSKTIRELAGYITDLKGFIKETKDMSLQMYIFDEYLKKVV